MTFFLCFFLLLLNCLYSFFFHFLSFSNICSQSVGQPTLLKRCLHHQHATSTIPYPLPQSMHLAAGLLLCLIPSLLFCLSYSYSPPVSALSSYLHKKQVERAKEMTHKEFNFGKTSALTNLFLAAQIYQEPSHDKRYFFLLQVLSGVVICSID